MNNDTHIHEYDASRRLIMKVMVIVSCSPLLFFCCCDHSLQECLNDILQFPDVDEPIQT